MIGDRPERSPARRLTIVLLSLAVLAVIVGAALRYMAAPADDGQAVAVTVRQLWRSAEAYEGERVKTDGVVRVFSPGSPDEHYALEQAGQYRVGLRGAPDRELARLVGATVAVEGVLRFEEGFGFAIQVERLAPLEATPQGRPIGSRTSWQYRSCRSYST